MDENVQDIPNVPRVVEMSFESFHEFKLPSELDPTKKDGKGGFLEGEIQLPLGVSEMMVTISTHPTFQFSPDKLARYGEDLKEFSPHLIYPVFKPKGQYLWDDMPMPFLQHWKLELHIKENTVSIKKNTSALDQGRPSVENAPEWLELFKLGRDGKLQLGKESQKLKVKILYPKTEQRVTAEGDVTVTKMLRDRGFPPDQKLTMAFCDGPNKKHLKECKLRVDIKAQMKEGGEWLGSGLSSKIRDSRSLLDIHDLSANFSCSAGGSKIIMLSESSISKDVLPEFQLWSKETGQPIENKDEEEELLNNAIENIRVQSGWLRFSTPPQPQLGEILSRGYMFKLVARRVEDGAVSNPMDFFYTLHNTCMFASEGDMLACFDCHRSEGNKIPETIKAKPGMRKRKPLEERRESETNCGVTPPKMMSPDSGMGDSPRGARRESNDSIDDPPFGDILIEGSGPGVEELEMMNLTSDGLISVDTRVKNTEAQDGDILMKLIETVDWLNVPDVQSDGDGIPKSSQASASADKVSTLKPKSSRPKDSLHSHCELHSQQYPGQGALLSIWTSVKNYVLIVLLAFMTMLLKMSGEMTLERKPGEVFSNLIAVYWPFPIILGGLWCFGFLDWNWISIVSLAVVTTALSVRSMTALKRLIGRDS